MSTKQHIIFSKGECPPTEVFYSYLEGMLSASEIRNFELHLADCEMCSDMLEGIEISGSRVKAEAHISKIKTQIRKKTQIRESKVIRIDRRMRYLAAAVVLVLAVSYFVLDNNFGEKKQNLVSSNQESSKDKAIAQEVSVAEEELKEDSSERNNQTYSETAPLGGNDRIKNIGEGDKPSLKERTVVEVDLDNVEDIIETKVTIDDEIVLLEKENNNISGARAGDVVTTVKSEVAETPAYTIVVADEKQKDESKSAIEQSEDGFTSGLFSKRESKRKENAQKPDSNVRNLNLSGGSQTDKKSLELESVKGSSEETDQTEISEESNNNKNVSPETEQYNLALSYLSKGENKKAEEVLIKITETKGNPYIIKAKWHLANIYIDLGETEKAGKLLREIIENKGELKTEAEELLESF